MSCSDTVTTLLSTFCYLPHRHRFQMTHYPSYSWSPPGLCFQPFFSIYKCILFTLLRIYGYSYHCTDDDILDRVLSKFSQTIQNLDDAVGLSFQSILTTWARQHSYNSVKTAHLCSILSPKDTESLVHAFYNFTAWLLPTHQNHRKWPTPSQSYLNWTGHPFHLLFTTKHLF